MNYTVAPFELADVQAPCTWSAYVDMFNVWRQCLSFDSRLLDDLFSEHLFAKFQNYHDNMYNSDMLVLDVDETLKIKQYRIHSTNIKMGELANYTFEQYVSANPNITMFTVQKHADFIWDYDKLHCFMGDAGGDEEYFEVKTRLQQSKLWNRRYEKWNKCFKEYLKSLLQTKEDLLNLCYNKGLEIQDFIKNHHTFRLILKSDFFHVFCKNPNVTWQFLKTKVINNSIVPLNIRIVALINPNVHWTDVINFCRANDLLLKKNFWADHNSDENTHLYTNNPNLIDCKKILSFARCDVLRNIIKKPNFPDEIIMSLNKQYYLMFKCGPTCVFSPIKAEKKFLKVDYNLMPVLCHVNEFNFLNNLYTESSINKNKPKICGSDLLYYDHRDGCFFKNIEDLLNNYKNSKPVLDIMLFQNPMCLEKIVFLKNVLTPAAVKIQRWYLKHFYRPDSRYVNTVLRGRFNALQTV